MDFPSALRLAEPQLSCSCEFALLQPRTENAQCMFLLSRLQALQRAWKLSSEQRGPTLGSSIVEGGAPSAVGRVQGRYQSQEFLHHLAGAAHRQVQRAPALAVPGIYPGACAGRETAKVSASSVRKWHSCYITCRVSLTASEEFENCLPCDLLHPLLNNFSGVRYA